MTGPSPDSFTIDELLREEPWLRQFARRLARDEDEAEDVVQSTWLAALRRPPRRQRNGRGNVRAWLSLVARNEARSRVRGEARRRAREEERVRENEVVESEVQRLEELELRAAVAQAVLALEEPIRGTLLSRYQDGLEPKAIAARDGVPDSTVRTRLAAGRRAVRETLDRRFGARTSWAALALNLGESAGPIIGAPWIAAGAAAGVAAFAALLAPRWLGPPESEPADPGHVAMDPGVQGHGAEWEPSGGVPTSTGIDAIESDPLLGFVEEPEEPEAPPGRRR